MAFNIGGTTISKIYNGSQEISRIYSGNSLIFGVASTAGVATRVGSATQFGVDDHRPQGLASNGTTLYMVTSASGDPLYTLNASTGVASKVGNTNIQEPGGITFHNNVLYMATDTGFGGQFWRINPSNARATLISSNFGTGIRFPSGLTSHNNTLYMVTIRPNALFTLNTSGVASRVGSATTFGITGFLPNGLASHGGKLYVSSGGTVSALYELNTSTGVASRVGSTTNFGINVQNAASMVALTSHGGKLYGIEGITDALYTISIS